MIVTHEAFTLTLDRKDMKQLTDIMGYDLTIPETLKQHGESEQRIREFMQRLHRTLLAAMGA